MTQGLSTDFLKSYTYTLSAFDSIRIASSGTTFNIKDATGKVNIQLDNGASFVGNVGIKYRVGTGENEFKEITITDTSGAVNTITIYIGKGEIEDTSGKFTGSVSVSNTSSTPLYVNEIGNNILSTPAWSTVASGAGVLVSAANQNRNEIIIQNLAAFGSGLDLIIGDSSVGVSRGIKVGANGSVTLNTNDAVYVYNPNGVSVNYAVLESKNI